MYFTNEKSSSTDKKYLQMKVNVALQIKIEKI